MKPWWTMAVRVEHLGRLSPPSAFFCHQPKCHPISIGKQSNLSRNGSTYIHTYSLNSPCMQVLNVDTCRSSCCQKINAGAECPAMGVFTNCSKQDNLQLIWQNQTRNLTNPNSESDLCDRFASGYEVAILTSGNSAWLLDVDDLDMNNIGHSPPVVQLVNECGISKKKFQLEYPVPINYKVNFNISDSSMTYDEEKDTYTLTLEIELPQKYEAYRYVCSFWISDNFGFNRVANLETNRTQNGRTVNLIYEDIPPKNNGYRFEVIAIVDNTTCRGFKDSAPKLTDNILAPFHCPTKARNLNIAEDEEGMRLTWDKPIPDTGLSAYKLDITVNKMTVELANIPVMKSSPQMYTYLVNKSYISGYLKGSQDNLLFFKFKVCSLSRYKEAECMDCSEEVYKRQTPQPGNDNIIIIVPAVVVGILFVILIVAFLLIAALVMWKRKCSDPNPEFSLTTSKHLFDPSNYSYNSYLETKIPPEVDRWMIPFKLFNSQKFKLLGSGNFSSVYYCTVKCPLSTPTNLTNFKNYTEQGVAVKLLNDAADEDQYASFVNEAKVMKNLSNDLCPYIVHLVGVQLEKAPAMIVMELVNCGNFLEILRQSAFAKEFEGDEVKFQEEEHSEVTLLNFKSIQESYVRLRKLELEENRNPNISPQFAIKTSQLLKYTLQVARGMQYLISNGVLHRDLACRNLLLSSSDIVKICDFGFACQLEEGRKDVTEPLPTDSKPLRWMAPEAFENDTYSEASDVWSFGVTLWEIFSEGHFPYPDLENAEILNHVKTSHFLKMPTQCDERLYNLMLKCWSLNREDRPTFSIVRSLIESQLYELYPYMKLQ